jgi:hypothetical protein
MKVPERQGLPHFSGVHIWNIKATGAKRAFDLIAYSNATLDNLRLDHLDIEAATAGTIANARNWTITDSIIKTADGSKPALTDPTVNDHCDTPYGEPKTRSSLPEPWISIRSIDVSSVSRSPPEEKRQRRMYSSKMP